MTKTLEQLANEYADKRLKRCEGLTVWKFDVRNLMRDAYKQGWKDGNTKGLEDALFAQMGMATDCKYFSHGCCTKGLPGTECNPKGCVAYLKKGGEE